MLILISKECEYKKTFSLLTWIFIFKPGNTIPLKSRQEEREWCLHSALGRAMVIAVMVLVWCLLVFSDKQNNHLLYQSYKVNLNRFKVITVCLLYKHLSVDWIFSTLFLDKGYNEVNTLDVGLKILKIMCCTRKVMGFCVTSNPRSIWHLYNLGKLLVSPFSSGTKWR